MRRAGHLVLELAAGEERPFVPAHADCVLAAAVPASSLDRGGRLDRALGGSGSFRVRGTFHARRSLGRAGQQATGWDDLERETGAATSFAVELAEPAEEGAVLDRLRQLPEVRTVGPMPLAQTCLTGTGPARRPSPAEVRAPFDQVRAGEAHQLEPGDERIRVGVVDTGVALAHAELRTRLLAGYDTVELGPGTAGGGTRLLGDVTGRDFSPQDEVGHGTHVAGIIGALGRQVPTGVAGRSLLLPARVLAAAVSGGGLPAGVGSIIDIDAGLKLAVDSGVRVANLSLGTPASEVDADGPMPHSAVVRYAVARGVVLVAASGNSGKKERFFPACLPGVVAVGAVGLDGALAAFSTTGDHVRLHAPGEAIVGLGLRGYRRSSGTSHASPFVAGAAALLLARAARRGVRPPAPVVAEALVQSATGDPPVLDIVRALAALDQWLETSRSTPARRDRWP